MARPKLGDSETERLHIKISADEVKAIEDWRYGNRVPSKSEAVRRLVQIGLRLEREIPKLISSELDITFKMARVLDTIEKQVKEAKETDADLDALVPIVRQAIKNVDETLRLQLESTDHLYYLVSEIAPFVNVEAVADLNEAFEKANEVRRQVEAGDTAYGRIKAERENSK